MSAPQGEDVSAPPVRRVLGERTIAAVHRMRSLESRLSSLLAVGIMCALGFALLVWYYRSAGARAAAAVQSTRAGPPTHASGDMALPSLGPISAPVPAPERDASKEPPRISDAPLPVAAAEPQPYLLPEPATRGSGASPAVASSSGVLRPTALERRLSGPAFTRQAQSSSGDSAAPPESAAAAVLSASAQDPRLLAAAPVQGSAPMQGADAAAAGAHADPLSMLLHPSLAAAAPAAVLPTQRLLLPKGAFVDCTLETAIDSTLPGMTTCITATDTFSADGTVVLLERGSKLVGETRGEVAQGSARVFVLWSEARTPSGIVVPLASPGTDELGRAGVSGTVDRHFWQRFGAALLISIIDGATQAAVASAGSGAVIYNPSASQGVTTEVLKGTLSIPPTVRKAQGDRIQILVARDIDFRPVYELRARGR